MSLLRSKIRNLSKGVTTTSRIHHGAFEQYDMGSCFDLKVPNRWVLIYPFGNYSAAKKQSFFAKTLLLLEIRFFTSGISDFRPMENSKNRLQKYEDFIRWLVTNIIIGALPFFVSFIVNWVASQMSFNNIFKISDLVFFAVILNTTTILDIATTKSINNVWKILLEVALIIMIIVGFLFYGIFSFYSVNPPASNLFNPIHSNLIKGCIVLGIASLILTISIQLFLVSYDKNKVKQ